MIHIGATGLIGPTGLQGLQGFKGMNGFQGATGMSGNTGLIGNTITPIAFIFNSKNDVFVQMNQNIPLNSNNAGGIQPTNTDNNVFIINSNNITIKKNGIYKIKAMVNVESYNILKIIGFNSDIIIGGTNQISIEIIKKIDTAEIKNIPISIQLLYPTKIYNVDNNFSQSKDTQYIGSSLIITKLS